MATTMSSTTLASAVAQSDKSLNLASVSGLEVGDIMFTGRTAYEVIAISGTRVDVAVGVMGTRPHAYPSGKRIRFGKQYDFALSRKAGTGDPANELVLPRVVLGTQGPVVQELVGNAENGYVWVTSVDEPAEATPEGVYNYTEPGAIVIAAGVHQLSGNGADAFTLAAPAIQDAGKANLNTCGGAVGDRFELLAGSDLKWYTLALNGVTPS